MIKALFKYWVGIIFLLPTITKGQIAGTFTSHLPYSNSTILEESGNKIFCAAQRGLYFFDKEDNSINILTSNNGLSDIEVTSMAFSEQHNLTVVAYNSGNIDIINDNGIVNLTDIVRTNSVVGSKRINNVTTNGNFAYLATDFGIVVLNLDRLEISETYRNIGPSGEELSIENVVIDNVNNLIYAHTRLGLARASLTGVNLLNFENWTYLRDSNNETINNFNFYAFDNGIVYGIIQRDTAGIFIWEEESMNFNRTDISTVPWSNINSIKVSNGRMTIAYGIVMDIVDLNTRQRDFFNRERAPFISTNDVLVDRDGSIWIADRFAGLISNFRGGFDTFNPNGPSNASVFGLHAFNDEVIAVSGGYNISFAPNFGAEGFYRFKDLKWTNFNREIQDEFSDFRDIVDITFDERNNRYFFASFGDNSVAGVVRWDGDKSFLTLDSANASLTGIPECPNNFRVAAVEMDDQGNLWVGNNFAAGNASVHRLGTNNIWESFNLVSNNGGNIDNILIDDLGQLWILVRGNTIIVWDPDTREERVISTSLGNGGLPASTTCYAKDRNGQIWIGTEEGVAVFEDPSGAITEEFYEATLPIFERRPLLQDEEILSIAVDGANRKWFGTSNGAFLFNETGTEIIEVINTSNSILPSNAVTTIAINEETGEVFLGTDDGIVGFQGDASEPEETFTDAKVFPNPINPEFEGNVTIRGLRENSIVKITDVSGRLIYEAISNGGTAVWNTRTLDGEKAKTGVYLIYAADSEFEESFIGKFIIVN